MSQNQRAVLFTAPSVVTVAPVNIPDAAPGELLIETEASVISPGTEGRCLRGNQPGSVPFPFIPGYATVGRVIQAPGPSDVPVGSRVLCGGTRRANVGIQWGGQVSHAVVPADSVVIVPEGVDPAMAALVKILAIALRGVRVSQTEPGQSVAVIGLGLIGTLSARLHQHFGARVLGLDSSSARVRKAEDAGLTAKIPSGSLEESVRSYFGAGADVVVDATGNPSVLSHSLSAARTKPFGPKPEPSAKLVVQGSYEGPICLPYQEAFLREITVLFPRDTTRSDQMEAMGLVASGVCKLDDLVSTRVAPEEAPSVYSRLASQEDLLTAAIVWIAGL